MPGSRKIPFVTGEYYHVFNRGIDKRIIFSSVHDFERFVMLLYVCNSKLSIKLDDLVRFNKKTFDEVLVAPRGEKLVSIGCWCLMDNHFHLLLKEESEQGITRFMKKLGTGYSMYFNAKHKRTGALFGGRFKSVHIDNDTHLQHLFSYIHLNPLDIGFPKWEEKLSTYNQKDMEHFLLGYRYSSYKEYLEINRCESVVLNKDSFPQYFFSKQNFESFTKCFFQKVTLRR